MEAFSVATGAIEISEHWASSQTTSREAHLRPQMPTAHFAYAANGRFEWPHCGIEINLLKSAVVQLPQSRLYHSRPVVIDLERRDRIADRF